MAAEFPNRIEIKEKGICIIEFLAQLPGCFASISPDCLELGVGPCELAENWLQTSS